VRPNQLSERHALISTLDSLLEKTKVDKGDDRKGKAEGSE